MDDQTPRQSTPIPSDEELIAMGRVLHRFITEEYDGWGGQYFHVGDISATLDGHVRLTPEEAELLKRLRSAWSVDVERMFGRA